VFAHQRKQARNWNLTFIASHCLKLREVGESQCSSRLGRPGGGGDGSVAIKRTGFCLNSNELLPLGAVAGTTRVMQSKFIALVVLM
jgi:hypothetical protein